MAVEASEDSATRSWLYHPAFPEDWTPRALHSMARWVNGIAFKNIQFTQTGRPVIKIAEIKGGLSDQTKYTQQTFDDSVRVRQGDLLFSWSGQPETSIDAFWWRGPEGWLNQHVFRVTPEEGIDTVFFYQLLRYLKPNFVGIARNKQTTGLGHVTKRDLENLSVAYPELPEQRAIAHILGSLDDKIELNRQMNATLDAMARALFASWFVDFEPVRIKAEGRDPSLPVHIAAQFPDALVATEEGELPVGWSHGTLADFADLNPEVWRRSTMPAEIQYVDLANTKWGRIEAITPFQKDDAPSRAQRVLRPNDTIVGTVRPGNGSFAFITDEGLTGSTGFALLRPSRPDVAEFTYLAATAENNIEALAHLADGAAYPAVRPEVVAATPIVVPPDQVLTIFSDQTRPMLAKIAQNNSESRTLAAIRDTLLPQLISGAIRVKDAETFLDRVL